MSTRAAAASTSRHAKRELVRLLYGTQLAGKGPEAHRNLDPSIYSYADLRKAYLERLQSIHPDKFAHKKGEKTSDSGGTLENNAKGDLHGPFVELQDAWDRYEKLARTMKNVSKGDKTEANFTMFGVGCSFSDSPEEQAARAEIMDQACRGWFSSGEIPETSTAAAREDTNQRLGITAVSLADDDLFVPIEDCSDDVKHNQTKRAPRRSLVSAQFRPRK